MSMTTELAQRMKAAAEREMIFRDTDETSNTWQYNVTPENVLALVEALEKAQQHIAELERMESALRPVGVMSQAAYHRLENRKSRFIALWPRPEIYLPRKRPDDGVIVYARTAGNVEVD